MASDQDSEQDSKIPESPKTKITDPTLNPRDPYYLHPGENSGATIVSPPLDDNNYHNWSMSMRRALASKNKLSFINGRIKKPSLNDANYELWERANNMVLSWINRTLSPHIAQSTVYFDSAFELWEDLRERFTKGNHFRFSDLLRKIHSIQQGDLTLSAYFTALKILWDELEDLKPTLLALVLIPALVT
ncbi:uncharacterized protein LOC131606018 [Vicia villosa]|uniref:uncharacterized protein LOC131606018 n=1 Tax=Vicia villosa TaxID=3911 RepID=UPI00273B88C5|nr:uncharacterized protein LOC131606018 [Vicia villosa]